MFDKFFENISYKFSIIAKLILAIGAACCIILFFACIIWAFISNEYISILYGFLILLLGPIAFYLVSLFVYAIAESLGLKARIARTNNEILKEISKTEIRKPELALIEEEKNDVEVKQEHGETNKKIVALDKTSVEVKKNSEEKNNESIEVKNKVKQDSSFIPTPKKVFEKKKEMTYEVKSDESGHVICPNCNTKQRDNRDYCLCCGAKFKYIDKK